MAAKEPRAGFNILKYVHRSFVAWSEKRGLFKQTAADRVFAWFLSRGEDQKDAILREGGKSLEKIRLANLPAPKPEPAGRSDATRTPQNPDDYADDDTKDAPDAPKPKAKRREKPRR